MQLSRIRHSQVVNKYRGILNLDKKVLTFRGHGADHGGGLLERGLDSLQFFLNLATLPLARLLDASVGRPELLVRAGEPSDAPSKVVLQLTVGAVRACYTLEGMDLTHDLCDAPKSITDKIEMKNLTNQRGIFLLLEISSLSVELNRKFSPNINAKVVCNRSL